MLDLEAVLGVLTLRPALRPDGVRVLRLRDLGRLLLGELPDEPVRQGPASLSGRQGPELLVGQSSQSLKGRLLHNPGGLPANDVLPHGTVNVPSALLLGKIHPGDGIEVENVCCHFPQKRSGFAAQSGLGAAQLLVNELHGRLSVFPDLLQNVRSAGGELTAKRSRPRRRNRRSTSAH